MLKDCSVHDVDWLFRGNATPPFSCAVVAAARVRLDEWPALPQVHGDDAASTVRAAAC